MRCSGLAAMLVLACGGDGGGAADGSTGAAGSSDGSSTGVADGGTGNAGPPCESTPFFPLDQFPYPMVADACTYFLGERDYTGFPVLVRNQRTSPIELVTGPRPLAVQWQDGDGHWPLDGCAQEISCDDAFVGACGCVPAPDVSNTVILPTNATHMLEWEGVIAVPTPLSEACVTACGNTCYRYIHPPAGRYRVAARIVGNGGALDEVAIEVVDPDGCPGATIVVQ